MADKMLIDASHSEETRVVVVRKNRIEEFDFESQHKKQLRGNIYLAKVTRVEPSLQAAFVDYGGNRHGFLAFSEIHPDYYQILQSDRQALLEAEAAEAEEARLKEEKEAAKAKNAKSKTSESDDDFDELNAQSSDDDKPKKSRRRRTRRKKSNADDANVAQTQSAPEAAATKAQDGTGAHTKQADEADDAAFVDTETVEDTLVENVQTSGQANDLAENESENTTEEPMTEASSSDVEDRSEQADNKPDTIAAMIETEDEISEPVDQSSEIAEPSEEDKPAEKPKRRRTRRKPAAAQNDEKRDDSRADIAADGKDVADPDEADAKTDKVLDTDADDADAEDVAVEEVGVEDALEELPETPRKPRKQYRIQEVIKRRQIILVQIVKEERGNKGAALTTYLSLAGRYSVLMPNTARGGGISRKITDMQDRKRLKEVAQELEVPKGMGVILRTAGASRTKTEIRRDFEYLMRLWESVRDLTLKSIAPCLVYEEGSLIKRSVRDLYNKDIGEVIVSGEDGYREAKDFMKMLMPSHAKAVQRYRGSRPIFVNSGIEAQLDQMMSPQVTLKSGGYLIINQTEALVAVDVNSGRSTRESSVEDTALQTNLEAAEEVARQLRLRDLAGLVVIDFIDMEEKRNNRAVEKRLKECLKNDRARIQVGRISHFGLLEMSRQRIRASVLESTTQPCPHCEGTGLIRSDSSFALQILRGIEEQLLKSPRNDVNVRTGTGDALYVLNNKRDSLNELEERFGVTILIHADPSITSQEFSIEKGPFSTKTAKVDASQIASSYGEADAEMMEDFDVGAEITDAPSDGESEDESEADENNQRKRRRRRRRRGRGGSDDQQLQNDTETASAETDNADETDETVGASHDFEQSDSDGEDRPKKRRRRGKRGGRKNRDRDTNELQSDDDAAVETDNAAKNAVEGSEEANQNDLARASDDLEQSSVAQASQIDEAKQAEADTEVVTATNSESADKPKRPRRRRTKKADSEEPASANENASASASASASADASPNRSDDVEGKTKDPATQIKDAESDEKAAASRKARTDLEQIASAPVLTSSNGEQAQSDAPKKTGWWRRAFKAE